MSEAAVVFDAVWKKFWRGERHDSLRDLIPAAVRRLVGGGAAAADLERREFWAVRDVSFDVGPGRALGIIGPNGAGKSTILKLLTRILSPTTGWCEVRGRAGALIEIAAGFHPDLTGRENVFLQGSIMGMRRAEMLRKFDGIVEFAELGPFIDTPVKRYSSGMNARLGFAIAAHLDPEVLIVDEALSVGDLSFQARAFDRLKEVIGRGAAVVVVSHQLERVAELCTEAILLDKGAVSYAGSPSDCIAAYVRGRGPAPDEKSGPIQLVALTQGDGAVASGTRASFRLDGVIENAGAMDGRIIGVYVRSLATGQVLFSAGTDTCPVALPAVGRFSLAVELQMNVPPGLYAVESSVWDAERWEDAGAGPTVTVRVGPGTGFWGTVQMNASMLAVDPGEQP